MIFSRKPISQLMLVMLLVCLLPSCFPKGKLLGVFNRTSVKNPPKDSTPFVFDNRIIIEPGVIAKDEQKRLESELGDYWDDTIKARIIQQWGLFYRVKSPQLYDSIGLYRSQIFMNSYLQSQGYYNAVLSTDSQLTVFKKNSELAASLSGAVAAGGLGALINRNNRLTTGLIAGAAGAGMGYIIGSWIDKKAKPEYRVTSIMKVNPGKRLHFDSIAFNFIDTANAPGDSALHFLASQIWSKSYLRKNDPYSKQIIAAELDRLVAHFRNNGYYRLNRDNLVAFVDTTDQLIDSLIIDPFELARKTAEAAESRRQKPTADVTIMQATQAKSIPFDTTVITRYYIGNIFYYPETDATTDIPDTLLLKSNFKTKGGTKSNIYMKYKNEESLFRMRPLIRHTYMIKGELYSDRSFYRTVNTLGQMGAWQQVEWRDSIKGDSIDFHIFLSPAKKKRIKYDLDLTRSTADFASSNNLFGVGGNITYLNRNFQRGAIQWSSFIRGGVELNFESKEKFLQTTQLGAGTSFSIPHLTWPFRYLEKKADAARTVININGSYTDRKDFFRVRSLITNMGWEYRIGQEATTIRFPNIELYSLDTLTELRKQFIANPFLRTAFNTGSVISFIYTYSKNGGSVRNPNFSYQRRMGFEFAGLVIPQIFPSTKDNLYQYIKVEGEYTMKWQYPKKAFVLHGFAGAGLNTVNDPVLGKTLPFFKQFIAGGPNSMRAWGLRQLGLGSSILSDTSTTFSDRFGDFQLEGNVEYRFQLADIGGVKFNSAVFMDIGNIWNLKKDPDNPAARLRLNKIPDDIAIALGVGLMRLNVSNFIIRVDFALKLKDPARRDAEWLFKKFTWRNQNGNANYAFQIGIGLPF
jgi:outer membrane protein insertion porin family